MEAWENNTLAFPPANIRFVRRVRTLDKDSKDPDTPARTFTELLAAAACPTDLNLHPTDAWGEFLRSVGDTVSETGQAIKRQVQSLIDLPTHDTEPDLADNDDDAGDHRQPD